MTIATMDDIASGLGAAQQCWSVKNITVPKAIGNYQSSWLGTGTPGAGVAGPAYTAGSGYTCSSSTTGAINYNNATTQNYLAKFAATSTIAGTLTLVDRLWSCSGMGYANTTYTVTTPGSLPARITDSGLGCQIWCESVLCGSATGTLTVSYVDPSSNTESAVIPSTSLVSAPVIGQMQPVPLAAGYSTGVSQIISATNSATWTSGSWSITIVKPIATIPISVAGAANSLDWAACALAKVPANACLMFIWQGATATANQVLTQLSFIDK
jgi:membrane-bound inhibitor of C-type lysozyme